jgi:hypothetical protein
LAIAAILFSKCCGVDVLVEDVGSGEARNTKAEAVGRSRRELVGSEATESVQSLEPGDESPSQSE